MLLLLKNVEIIFYKNFKNIKLDPKDENYKYKKK